MQKKNGHHNNEMNVFKYFNALLVTNPTNIRYLTGFVGVGNDEREAYLLVLKNKAYLLTSSLYREQAKKLTLLNCYIVKLLESKKPLEIVEISRENPLAKQLAQVLRRMFLAPLQGTSFKGVSLGFEEENLTVSEFQKLKKELKDITLLPTKNRIEELRMIKREDEIENIKKASKLTDEGYDFILGKLKPGVAESEIAWEIEAFFRKRGAEVAFFPIVAFGKNSSQPHYQIFEKAVNTIQKQSRLSLEMLKGLALQKNDMVLLDFGARINGYCSDMTRVVFIGKPKKEWKRAYQTVLKAQQAALEYLTGSDPVKHSGAMADRIARETIKKAGFPPYPHSLGHNVGLAIHESPRLTMKKETILKPGMVFSVEPGIYQEGRYGIRIEDLVLLKKDGIEILTKSSKEPTIVV